MTKSDGRIPLASARKDRTSPAHSEEQRSGHDLSRLLSPEPAPTGLVTPRFLSVIAAVEEAHRGNTGPCDLDPRRIFLRSDGTVELSTYPPPASGMTVVLSFSKYFAPEMFEENAGPTDNRLLDSYVLGFVFYEILLGSDLFEQQFRDVSGQGRFGWLAWHTDKAKRAKPLSEVIHGFPYMLSSLIDGMMAKEASERITDLQRIADTISGASHATMAISDLSALQGGDEGFVSPKVSVAEKVDAFWFRLMSKARRGLRKLLWGRIFTRKNEQVPVRARDAQKSSRQGGAEKVRSVKAYRSPNTKKGSGRE